jgi:Zn-dependent protease
MSMPNLSPEMLLTGFISYVVFLFSTTCHEAAHAFVAKLGGDTTAALGGQVTLNPIPHIRRSPFGMVVIPLLSFFFSGGMIGWASAPYDPLWERRHPRRAAWMALGGPAANFSLMLNLLLGTFNLLPVPPLDGSTAIMLLMDERRAQGYLDWIRSNNYGIAGLLVGLLVFQRVFPYVQSFVLNLLF